MLTVSTSARYSSIKLKKIEACFSAFSSTNICCRIEKFYGNNAQNAFNGFRTGAERNLVPPLLMLVNPGRLVSPSPPNNAVDWRA